MLQFSEFVWALSYSVWDVFNNFPLIDATDRSKISSDQRRFFIALNLYPFHFSRTLPLKGKTLKLELLNHSSGSLQISPIKIWGESVHGFMSYDRTSKQTERQTEKQKILLYIYKLAWYKLALPGDYSWKFRIFTPRWEHYFHRVPQSEYQENRSMDSWVMIGHSNRQTDNRDN